MTSDTKPARTRISIIVAMAGNRVIGANNALPWHLPADLKRFKALTMGHHIVMGRKTFESIGRVLPGRTSVVMTRNRAWRADGVVVAGSLAEAISRAGDDSEVFVIGGEEIFREALGFADRIYLTRIDREFQGDAFFPQIDPDRWTVSSREALPDGDLRAEFSVLERCPPR